MFSQSSVAVSVALLSLLWSLPFSIPPVVLSSSRSFLFFFAFLGALLVVSVAESRGALEAEEAASDQQATIQALLQDVGTAVAEVSKRTLPSLDAAGPDW